MSSLKELDNLDRNKQQQKSNKIKILTPKFKERKVKELAFSFPWCPYICECSWKKTQTEKKIKGNDWPKFLLHTKNGKLSCTYEPYLLNSIRFTKPLIK